MKHAPVPQKMLHLPKGYMWSYFFHRCKNIFVCLALLPVMAQAQANLPYVQDFQTPFGLYPIASVSGVGIFRSGVNVFTYEDANRFTTNSREVSAQFRDINNLASGTENSGASNFFAVTATGGNQSLLLSFFNRAQAVEFALNSWAAQNLTVNFNLTQVEQSAGFNVNIYLQVFDGTQFVTVPGFYYSTAGVLPLTSTSVGVALPNLASNQGNLRVRLLAFPDTEVSSGYISFTIDNVSIAGASLAQGWTNPTPQALNYVQDFGSSDIYPYPGGIQVMRSNTSFSYPLNYTKASSAVFSNRNTQFAYDSSDIVSGSISVDGLDITALTTTGFNSKLHFSPFSRVLGAVASVNTTGRSATKLSYKVQFTENGGGNPNDTVVTMALEYRVGTSGPFKLIPAGVFSTTGLARGTVQNFNELTLPNEVDDKSVVQFRWLVYANYPLPSTKSYSLSLDDISITGVGGILPASKLVLNSGVPTGSILINTPFNVVINVQNDASAITTVSGATQITLSAVGASLSGTTTLIIPAGVSSATFTGLTFAATASGVRLFVFSVSGNALAASPLSASFNVLGSRPLPLEGFTYPTPKQLPYSQNWGTNADAWVDGSSDPASTYLLPTGMVALRGSGSGSSPLPARTIDDAIFADFPSNGFVGGGAVISPISVSGNNVAMELFRSNTRANGLLLAVNTNGFENINLRYTIALNTSSAGAYFGMVALYRVGTSGAFTTISGSLFESTATGVVLNTPITYSFTLPGIAANTSNLQIKWVYWNASPVSGIWIDDISVTGSQTDYLTISTPNMPFVGDDITVTIRTFDKNNNPKNVTNPTVITITGNTGLSGTTVVTIPSGLNTVVLTGLRFTSGKYQASLQAQAISGDAFGNGSSNTFNVSGLPTAINVLRVLPEGNIFTNKPFSVRFILKDSEGKTALAKSNTSFTTLLETGSGELTGTVTGTAIAGVDSIINISGLIYDKAEENVVIKVIAINFTTGLSAPFNVISDPSAGVTFLYRETFEKTSRAIKGPNGTLPAVPSDMKIFNLDNISIDNIYAVYGSDAFVMLRRRTNPLAPIGDDDIAQYGSVAKYTFDISESEYPDSNWVAAATSYFANTSETNSSDKWLVTPSINLVGNNLTLSLQAMSATSSGNYEDKFQVLFYDVDESGPIGSTLNPIDWEALPMRNTILETDSVLNSAPTVPITYTYALPESFNGATVAFAVRLVTGQVFPAAAGGDRLLVDNIAVSAGGSVSTKSAPKVAPLSVHPNPTNGRATLAFNITQLGDVQYKVLDISGTVVHSGYIATTFAGPQVKTIDLSSLAAGVYQIQVISPYESYSSKVVKQ